MELAADKTHIKWMSRFSPNPASRFQFLDLVIEDLVGEGAPQDAGVTKRIKSTALAEPMLAGNLISEESTAAVVNVTIRLPDDDMTIAVHKVAASARELRDIFAERYPYIELTREQVMVSTTPSSLPL